MEPIMSYEEARRLLFDAVQSVGCEKISLSESIGRVLAEDVYAVTMVPPFDRSPYDGYAVRSEDTVNASADAPVELRILEEIPAGSVPSFDLTKGTAAKILTGAPVPNGADAVVMFERTVFTDSTVKIDHPVPANSNIIYAGEDVAEGQLIVRAGIVIDGGVAGSLAAQGMDTVSVFRRPKVALISTGSEVVEVGSELPHGKIFNASRFIIQSELMKAGCDMEYFGIASDRTGAISERINDAINSCDAVLLTGGVSVGDYDLTPSAMKMSGAEIMVTGIGIKPGKACAFGTLKGKLVCGLSGNPAAAVVNLQTVLMPALKKLAGRKNAMPDEFELVLAEGFPKKSKHDRLLSGRLAIENGAAVMHVSDHQGNSIVSGMIDCDVCAVIPAGSDAVPAGAKLKGFRI